MFCIYYPIQFQEYQEQVRVLLNNNSKVNAINPNYTQRFRPQNLKDQH